MLRCIACAAVGSRIAFATCDAVAVDQLLYRLDNGQTLDAQNAQFAWKLGLQQRWQVPRGEILASAIRRGKIPKWGFPSFGRCRLVDEEVYSLEDESIDETVRDVIFGTVSAAQNAGFHVQVSRFDLFHGHFVQRRNGDVALLLHASEYPAMNPDSFPVHLGYCQADSPLQYSSTTMQFRNIVVLFSENIRAFVLDAEADCVKAVIPEYARKPVYVLYEDTLGQPLADVYFLSDYPLGWTLRSPKLALRRQRAKL